MCQLVEDYAKEKQINNIILLFKNGASLELVQKSFPNFTIEEIIKIQKES